MTTPTIRVEGVERVVQRFDALPERLRAELRRRVARFAFEITDAAVSNVSGKLLRRRTGALAGSIAPRVTETSDSITGIVGAGGVAAKYAAVHEYGFSGTVPVKAHLRAITQAWGRAIEPRSIYVGAHTRAMNIAEKAYLRGALRERRGAIVDGLAEAARVAAGSAS
jgi:phage gpG-like protein